MKKISSTSAHKNFELPILSALILITALLLPLAHQQANAGSHPPNPSTAATKNTKGRLPITELTEDQAILHALNRLAYGPTPNQIEAVRKIGLEKWIDQQLNPNSIDDSALDARLERYPTLKMSSDKLVEKFPQPNQAAKKEGISKEEYQQRQREKAREAVDKIDPANPNAAGAQQLAKIVGPQRIVAELSMAKLDRAIYSNRQLEAVMEDFWFNHFNVFAGKNQDRWLLTAYARDTIRPHTLGKFQDLLINTAKSPAMLVYLDNWLSADPDAAKRLQQELAMRRRRFEGVFGPPMPRAPGAAAAAAKKQDRGLNENYGREVMELHTLGVDAGYTQQDVIEMAKCLTGWTVHAPRKDPDFFFDERIHTNGKKVVLGRTFNYGGMKDGEEALKMLANHPSTAKFISTKLARHFVQDNPPPALVDRMAQTFTSTNGDIRAVLKTMIYSPEFWSKESYRAKVKQPFELAASTARALGAEVDVTLPLAQWVGRMGQPLFQAQPPTGYSDKSETWVNTGALLNRLNFALALSSNKVPGTKSDLEALLGQEAVTDPHKALEKALATFLDGQASQQTQTTLEARLEDPQILQAALDDPVKHVNQQLIAGLVLGAPEFQRR